MNLKKLFLALFFCCSSLVQASGSDTRVYLISSTVSATADTTTTSTTDVALNSMTSTPAVGIYLVVFEASCDFTGNNGQDGFYSMYVGGVLSTSTVRRPSQADNSTILVNQNQEGFVIRISQIVSLNGSTAVDIRWRSGAAVTMTTHQRSMTFVRLGDQ